MDQHGPRDVADSGALASSTAPALTLKKKGAKRISAARDESEFVSVEVGMRELRRRLSGSGKTKAGRSKSARDSPGEIDHSTVAAPNGVAAVATNVPPVKRVRFTQTTGTTPSTTTTPANTVTTAATSTTTTTAAAKPRTAKPPTSRSPKPTIADIRAALMREQQERIEQRIQSLHRTNGDNFTAASSNSSQAVPAAVFNITSAPVQQPQQPHVAAPPHPQPPTPSSTVVTSSSSSSSTVVAAAATATAIDPIKSEFTSDNDAADDMAFLAALDQVERSLAPPSQQQQPPRPPVVVGHATPSPYPPLSRAIKNEPAVSAAIKSEPPLAPAQQATTMTTATTTYLSTSQAAAAMAPDAVLRAFERLQRENEHLRQSNERLQAAAASAPLPVVPDAFEPIEAASNSMEQQQPAANGDVDAIKDEPLDAVDASLQAHASAAAATDDATISNDTQTQSSQDEVEPDGDEAPASNQATQKDDGSELEADEAAATIVRTSTIDRGHLDQYKVHDKESENDDMDDDDDDDDVGEKKSDAQQDERMDESIAGSDHETDCFVPFVSVARARLRVAELSSTETESEHKEEDESESESESDDATASGGVANALEAALKAAASDASSHKPKRFAPLTSASRDATFSLRASAPATEQPPLGLTLKKRTKSKALKRSRSSSSERSDAASAIIAAAAVPVRSKHQRTNISSATTTSLNSTIKSTLLWPALDAFYEFVLDLSPRRIELLPQYETFLQRYRNSSSHNSKLPPTYATLKTYMGVQTDAIMQELAASLRNAEQQQSSMRLNDRSSQRLCLTSVSPCGRSNGQLQQAFNGSHVPLSSSAIFSESGFSGTTTGANDFILAFQAIGNRGHRGNSRASASSGAANASDLSSGDLVLLRSPQWKSYDLVVYGVVLCNSVVALSSDTDRVGNRNNSSSNSNNNSRRESDDLVCVLIRTHAARDHAHAKENFSVLTEMCLANQQHSASNWSWRLSPVHNLTTSAREFQAIQSVAFFSPSIKQSLLDGKLSSNANANAKVKAAIKTTKTSVKATAAKTNRLAPALRTELEKTYNASQLDAILGCIGDEQHVIIQGPPGTGKTKTILGVLSALLDGAALSGAGGKPTASTRIRIGASLKKSNSNASTPSTEPQRTVAESTIRILVAAPSNAAVDELIVRLLRDGVFDATKGCSYTPRIVRVGRPESLQLQQQSATGTGSDNKKKSGSHKTKWRKYAKEVEAILLENLVAKHRASFPSARIARQSILQHAQVVFCTLSGAGSVAMCDFGHEFDALVIDEAAQATEASCLIPFKFRPRRIVLVGDHQQLPATVISKRLLDVGYDRSLFQRFVENGSRVFLLTRQYRMHPDIAAFPSWHFYNGKLVQDAALRTFTTRSYHTHRLFQPFVFFDVLRGAQSQVDGSKSLRNLTEVDFVVLLVRSLVTQFSTLEWRKKIGIIAPYKQQIYELSAALTKVESATPLEIEVNTVDGFQGREKEIIIYSCVRTSSNHYNKQRNNSNSNSTKNTKPLDAFWADERRMNVAITRAKCSLWIVGNSHLLEQSRAWRALICAAKDRRSYVQSTDVEL